MKRREFITLFGGTAAIHSVAGPLAARAQQQATAVVGVLHGVSAAQWAERMVVFRRTLAEMGFVERRNVVIEARWADGQFERLPALTADLIRRKVAVLVVGASDVAIRAAMSATKTIPIVFATASDPVESRFVTSLARPEGNVTGVTQFGTELAAKRLELLHELVPGATKVGLLVNPNNPRVAQDVTERTEAAARQLGLEIVVLKASTEDEVGSAIAAAVQQQIGALNLGNDAYLSSRGRQIAFLALRHGLPTMSYSRPHVDAGALMSYGPDVLDTYRLLGNYVGRILKGQKPADLPVQQPTKFEMFINLTTAKAIGLKIPEAYLLRADEVIE
jgi:putative tryptophan/tyrosine transport system substrate-binding protein